MAGESARWMEQAEDDLVTAYKNLEIDEEEAAIFFGHQAAEKGMKSLEIDRRGEYSFTHDLVRLYVELELPERFMSALEDLNRPTRRSATPTPQTSTWRKWDPGSRRWRSCWDG